MERKVDHLGRIVLPMEFRKVLNITNGTRLEMKIVSGNIMLSKSDARCVYCGSLDELKEVKGIRTCHKCIEDIKLSKVFLDA